QKLAKLKNIASKPYLEQITIADLKKVIQKYSLNIEIVRVKGQEMIKFDSSDKWAILRLLDDDYLESVMTGNRYEVNSKRDLTS
ncbi:MAG: Kiwa anti-phage protein KwaB-like domain-containing protein, partial [Spirochaetota bacterium]